ncbi:MAG: hypothetical protein ACREJM_05460, partial [Candidatus Saccharimonadales bacterium]
SDSRKAPIKKIESLDVAQWAIADSLESASPLDMPAGSINVPAAPAATPPAAPAAAEAAAADAVKAEDLSVLVGRYLDDKGQPLTAIQLGDPYSGPYAEFKQVFVHMKLVMDHRRMPELMAACGNATLPVETREVRIQMLEPQAASGAANNVLGFGGMGMNMFGGGNQDADVETMTYDAVVELSGVIYLYNFPDLAKLGTGTSGSPANRFFGVPSSVVSVPRGGRRSGGVSGMTGYGGRPGNSMQGMMGGGMGGGRMPGGPPGMQGMNMTGGTGNGMAPPMGPQGMGGGTGAKP